MKMAKKTRKRPFPSPRGRDRVVDLIREAHYNLKFGLAFNELGPLPISSEAIERFFRDNPQFDHVPEYIFKHRQSIAEGKEIAAPETTPEQPCDRFPDAPKPKRFTVSPEQAAKFQEIAQLSEPLVLDGYALYPKLGKSIPIPHPKQGK